jgi:superfamily II DNA or RNA helicase
MPTNRYHDDIESDQGRARAIARFVKEVAIPEQGAPGIIFVRTLKAGAHQAEALAAALGPKREVPLVSSKMREDDRRRLARQLRAKDKTLPVVVALPVWGTGLNIPGLRWILVASEGSAPIGTKQHAGRPIRIDQEDEDKQFVIYDWTTMSDDDRYEKHSDKRAKAYAECGYEVYRRKSSPVPGPPGTPKDAQLLEELIEDDTPLVQELVEPSLGQMLAYAVGMAALPAAALIAFALLCTVLVHCCGLR